MKEHTAAKKIKSGRGASISFALFILLICAVVGSIVLKAATASAGRLSKLAESDRRYYSVNSAAELISKALDGEEVVISGENTSVTTTIVTYTIEDDNVEKTVANGPSTPEGDPTPTIKQSGDSDTILALATKEIVFRGNDPKTYFWSNSYNPGSIINHDIEDFLLSHGTDDDLADLQVDIKVKITDGRLHMILKNHTEEDDEAVYTVELFFSPSFNTESTKSSTTNTELTDIVKQEGEPATEFTETTTLTETLSKTTTVSWILSEIRKGK